MMASLKRSVVFRSGVVAFLGLLSFSFQAKAQSLSFANLPGTSVNFGGGTFSFSNNGNGYQFVITAFNNLSVSPSVGLNGYVTNVNSFAIGAITSTNVAGFQLQSAPVTGSATLHITDASSNDLTGAIQWIGITTLGSGSASAGDLDLQGVVNLNSLVYGGANGDLQALALAGSATDVVSFQFAPGLTLSQLAGAGGTSSYSGVITAVPEPSTLVLVAMAIGLGVFFQGRRQARS